MESGGTKTAPGHKRSARTAGMAERTRKALASYEAAQTTERLACKRQLLACLAGPGCPAARRKHRTHPCRYGGFCARLSGHNINSSPTAVVSATSMRIQLRSGASQLAGTIPYFALKKFFKTPGKQEVSSCQVNTLHLARRVADHGSSGCEDCNALSTSRIRNCPRCA